MGDRQLDEPESGSNITRTQDNTGTPNPLSRQDDIHGRHKMAPITPEIGALGYDFDDINAVFHANVISFPYFTFGVKENEIVPFYLR